MPMIQLLVADNVFHHVRELTDLDKIQPNRASIFVLYLKILMVTQRLICALKHVQMVISLKTTLIDDVCKLVHYLGEIKLLKYALQIPFFNVHLILGPTIILTIAKLIVHQHLVLMDII